MNGFSPTYPLRGRIDGQVRSSLISSEEKKESMQVHPDQDAQEALVKWSKLEAQSRELADVLSDTRDWATVNEPHFAQTDHPSLSIEELKFYDRFGTPERYLMEVWLHCEELARQIDAARNEELKAQSRKHQST